MWLNLPSKCFGNHFRRKPGNSGFQFHRYHHHRHGFCRPSASLSSAPEKKTSAPQKCDSQNPARLQTVCFLTRLETFVKGASQKRIFGLSARLRARARARATQHKQKRKRKNRRRTQKEEEDELEEEEEEGEEKNEEEEKKKKKWRRREEEGKKRKEENRRRRRRKRKKQKRRKQGTHNTAQNQTDLKDDNESCVLVFVCFQAENESW